MFEVVHLTDSNCQENKTNNQLIPFRPVSSLLIGVIYNV